MSASSFPQISDELLSAYLDGAVSADEREQIEHALQGNDELTWRMNTLRQTVLLLRALPAVQSRRNFSLEAILAAEKSVHIDGRSGAIEGGAKEDSAIEGDDGAETVGQQMLPPLLPSEHAGKGIAAESPRPTWWERLGGFLNSGSPFLRNAAMGMAALFVVVAIGSSFQGGGGAMSMESAAFAPESIALMSAPAAASAGAEDASVTQSAAGAESSVTGGGAAAGSLLARQHLKNSAEEAPAEEAPAEEAPAEEAPAEEAPAEEVASDASPAAMAMAAVSPDEAPAASSAPAARAAEPNLPAPNLPAESGQEMPSIANLPQGGGLGGALQSEARIAPEAGREDSTGLDEAMRESMDAPAPANILPAASVQPAPAAPVSAEVAGDAAARETSQTETSQPETAQTETTQAETTQAETIQADAETRTGDAESASAPASGGSAADEAQDAAQSDEESMAEGADEDAVGNVLGYDPTPGAAVQTTPESIALASTGGDSAESATESEADLALEEESLSQSAFSAAATGAMMSGSAASESGESVPSESESVVSRTGLGIDFWLVVQIALGVAALLLFLLWWRSRNA